MMTTELCNDFVMSLIVKNIPNEFPRKASRSAPKFVYN